MTIYHIATNVSTNPAEWEIQTWSLAQVLNEINRDHAEGWTNYDQNNWQEGWVEWVDPECKIMISPHLMSCWTE